MQWNIHWQCFKSLDCKVHAEKALATRLSAGLDFANIVMLEDHNDTFPSGWEAISQTCGLDITTLLFNASRWQKVAVPGAGARGCMITSDRSYVVQAFDHSSENLRIVVVGAHFPHGQLGSALTPSIKHVAAASGSSKTLLIADTNILKPEATCPAGNLCESSTQIFEALAVPGASAAVSTDLLKTCCLNDPGFSFTFDRIIANFGTSMATQLHDDPAPSWAIGAFHKAISGRLHVSLPQSSGVDSGIRMKLGSTPDERLGDGLYV